ncbi:MAG: hypothetical protein RL514_2894 [Verrucomicrobiota bacterium]
MTMHFSGMDLRTSLRLALLGVALLSGVVALPAGEPIRFSGRTGAATPQDFDHREPLLPVEARAGARGMGRGDFSPDMLLMPAPSVTPTTGLTRRQLEAQDQRRNWIFQTPDAILKQGSESADENPLTRDDREDKQQPKSAIERFLENSDGKADAADKMKTSDAAHRPMRDRKDNPNQSNRNSRDATTDNGKTGELATGLETRAMGNTRGGEERNLFSASDARGSALGRVFSEGRERERDRERAASLETFRQSFNNPWAQPAAGGLDPARPFGTGAAGNAGMAPAGLDRRNSAGALGQTGRSATDLGPRSGLGDFDPKNPLNYGTAETVLKQNEAPRPAPKPIVLEVPRRKF